MDHTPSAIGLEGKSKLHAMDAWKWKSFEPNQWYRSIYNVYTDTTKQSACKVFMDFVASLFPGTHVADCFSEVFERVMKDQDRSRYVQLWSTEDLDVHDKSLGRQTLDLNIVDYEIPLRIIDQNAYLLTQLFAATGDSFGSWLTQWSALSMKISHIAAGIDQEGEKYVTIYIV
jgi:hypothetical protein